MRFGVISTAGIGVGSMIPAIQQSSHDVVAIGSRDGDVAREVADDMGIDRSYGSYEALLADGELDAVYNPLPNALHAEWTRAAADEGLDVLCEKPITTDAASAADLFDYCAERDVALMEAFMYHFHPRTERLREIVADNLGEPRYATSTFTWRMADGAEDIKIDPGLGGGALYDVGCYTVSGIRGVFGEPDRVYAESVDTRESGVDTQTLGTLAYDDGPTANFVCGFDTTHDERIRIDSDDGWLEAHDAYGPDPEQAVTLTYDDGSGQTTETFDAVDHYRLEVEAFADAVEAGEEPPVTRAESLANMQVLDALYASADRGEPVDVGEFTVV